MQLFQLSRRTLGVVLALSILSAAGCSPAAAPGSSAATPSSSTAQAAPASIATPSPSPAIQAMDFSQKLNLRKPQDPIRQDPNILFLGNSFTFANDLPGAFQKLSESGGFAPGIVELSDGGYHLSYFADPEDELGAEFYQIVEEYPLEYVILQEQSRLPTLKEDTEQEMFPAARTLDKMIKSAGGQTVFLMTWAYKNGDDLTGYGIDAVTTRDEMQTQLAQSYTAIADELGALLSPAGIAFVRCADAHPEIELWDAEDNMHPTPEGTYLAACTLYATVYNQSPAGLAYIADLDADTAAILQQTAADLVLA